MKEELKEFDEFVDKVNSISSSYIQSRKELKEPPEEDVHFLFELFHSCS